MKSESKNEPSSSRSSGKLRVDFYESGDGETILITFPHGGLGIVDGHPTPHGGRPPIADLTAGKHIHFVCLSHPHADHGVDLIPVVESHPDIESFWHSTSDVEAFIYCITETDNYPSPVRQFVHDLKRGWAEFLVDLYGAVAKRNLDVRQLHSNVKPIQVDGVTLYILSPEELVKNRFVQTYRERAAGRLKRLPDPNLLSTVLALRYGSSVLLLGSDALKDNWSSATRRYRESKLPRALLLKVPHHGASNALLIHPRRGVANYLDLCSRDPRPKAVLFAGDAKHPSPEVYQTLRARADVCCLSNGLAGQTAVANPLGIAIPGARAVTLSRVCNPMISFEFDENGGFVQHTGVGCEVCPTAPR